ncbi:MAG: hypothetical protein N3H31_00720 [Candidatus Nezhaarchaeota archaeon]|nr:hypothetical protein [Candidatus Nezhaarchaeota archaeon]
MDYIVMRSLGTHFGIYRVDTALHLQSLANKLGLDAIEADTLIGLLMELQQRAC